MAKKDEDMTVDPNLETKSGTYTVETPVTNYNGIVAGVQFAYGKAEVHDGWILEWFKENGYKISEK
jgi:hypothetical protein